MNPTGKKIKVEIKYYANEDDDVEKATPVHTDSIVFQDEGLASLKEIHPNPTNAIVMAIQLALRLRRFDANARGDFKIESRYKKGNLDIPEWKQ